MVNFSFRTVLNKSAVRCSFWCWLDVSVCFPPCCTFTPLWQEALLSRAVLSLGLLHSVPATFSSGSKGEVGIVETAARQLIQFLSLSHRQDRFCLCHTQRQLDGYKFGATGIDARISTAVRLSSYSSSFNTKESLTVEYLMLCLSVSLPVDLSRLKKWLV